MSNLENGVITQSIHNGPIQSELREELVYQMQDELSADRAVELGPELSAKHMDSWMKEMFYANIAFRRSFQNMEDPGGMFDRGPLENEVKADYEKIIREVHAPLVIMWARWIADLETKIPNSKAVFFPRDGYLPAAAYDLIQKARGVEEEVSMLHLSRVGVGMKDEVDPQGHKVDKGREHYDMVIEYFQTVVDQMKAQGKDTIILADSLPYGYMMEALFERGVEGFIAQIGNVGKDWKEGTIPDELKQGLATAFNLKTIPASFYSMSWLQEYDGTTIEGLPGILNIVAHERLQDQDSEKLEAIADLVEVTHDKHDTVTHFEHTERGVEPVLEPLPSQLGMELAHIADRVVREETEKMLAIPGYGLTQGVANDQFYADMAEHLKKVMGYIDEARETGWSHGVLQYPLGRIKKHDDFIQYAIQMGDQMFPHVASHKEALSTVQSKV